MSVDTHKPGNTLSMRQRRSFTAFLLLYLAMAIMATHSETNITWQALLALGAGGAIAVMAHGKYGIIPSVLLVAHITIEWFVHARHGWHYNTMMLTLASTHMVFDGVFLCLEARRHWGAQWKWWLATVVVSVIIIFWYFYTPPAPQLKSFAPHLQSMTVTHTHTYNAWQLMLIGGIVGCVVSHLWHMHGFSSQKMDPHSDLL